MFKGSIVALITPFKNNKLDEDCYISLINHHLKNGTSGLVPAGTTGESPTLTHSEHERVIEICVRESKGKIPVIAGTGSNSTEEAITLTKYAEKIGADAALVVTPYYNKPTQEGLNRVDQQKKKMGPDFIQLSGEDGTALEFNLRGGVGCISVSANVATKLCAEFQEASTAKNNSNLLSKAKQINDKLMPLHKSLFIESSPSPVKYAASLLKLCTEDVRLPLVKITEETKKSVKSAMTYANLL